MTENEARVPKWMSEYPDLVVWAFRHGVVAGMRSGGRVLRNQPGSYVIADRRLLLLADRVRVIWMRRHGLIKSGVSS